MHDLTPFLFGFRSEPEPPADLLTGRLYLVCQHLSHLLPINCHSLIPNCCLVTYAAFTS